MGDRSAVGEGLRLCARSTEPSRQQEPRTARRERSGYETGHAGDSWLNLHDFVSLGRLREWRDLAALGKQGAGRSDTADDRVGARRTARDKYVDRYVLVERAHQDATVDEDVGGCRT